MRTLLSSTAFIVLVRNYCPSKNWDFQSPPTQVSVLGSADVRESLSVPTLTLGGTPASPHQIRVLTPRPKITEQERPHSIEDN
jgi:hypothetical protein